MPVQAAPAFGGTGVVKAAASTTVAGGAGVAVGAGVGGPEAALGAGVCVSGDGEVVAGVEGVAGATTVTDGEVTASCDAFGAGVGAGVGAQPANRIESPTRTTTPLAVVGLAAFPECM
jgi:hypothetical protein